MGRFVVIFGTGGDRENIQTLNSHSPPRAKTDVFATRHRWRNSLGDPQQDVSSIKTFEPAAANRVYDCDRGTSRLSLILKNAELPEKEGKHLPHKSQTAPRQELDSLVDV